MDTKVLTKLKPADLIPLYGWHNYRKRTTNLGDILLDIDKTSGSDYIESLQRIQDNRLITGTISLAPVVGVAMYYIAKYTV